MGDGQRPGFRDALNRFVRTYSFVSQIAAFTRPALVPDFVSCRALSSYLPDTSTVERLDLGTEVELIRSRHQMTFTGSLSLSADVGEVRSFYGEGKGGRQGLDLEHLSSIIGVLNDGFGTDLTDIDEAAPGPVRGQLGRRRGACRSGAKQEHR
jgi:type I restriction enzyme R subunit